MNHGGVQSSPVQQMVAAGSPTWWSINNIRPPLHHHHHHPFLAAPPPHHFPPHHQFAPPSSWNIEDDLPPDSWSQLLLGGLVGEDDDKPGSNHIGKMENWEQQFLNNQIPNVIKHENDHMGSSRSSYNNYRSPGNVELYQGAKPSTNNCWSHQQLMVSASSPKSCVTTTNLSNNLLDFSPQSECNSTATGGAAAKKARITQPVSSAHSTFKVRKEKLGDRVTALHQLVSPFGKTDTASVLLEAIGYIKFLQNQIEALTQPYLGSGSSANMIRPQHPPIQGERNFLFPEDPGQLVNENCMKRKGISDLECDDQEPKQDLKTRGLCLVPISYTLDVGGEINGADYWAPSFAAANFR